jgi:hypothetical protein
MPGAGPPATRGRTLQLGALVLLALAALTGPAGAQVVKGRVVLAGTDRPIAEAAVHLIAADGARLATSTSDTAGNFRISAPRLGMFRLRAEHIGMTTVESGPFQVNVSQAVEVELRMATSVVPLEPLTVTARSALDIGFLSGYFQRVQRHELMRTGHIFTRDRIEARMALDVADLLRDVPSISVVDVPGRLPSIMFRSNRGECVPKVYLDGMRQNRGGAAGSAAVVDEVVRPYDLEGVEVYRGISEVPAEFYDEGHCGVILLWTRRDTDGGRPTNFRRILLGLGALMAMGALLMR